MSRVMLSAVALLAVVTMGAASAQAQKPASSTVDMSRPPVLWGFTVGVTTADEALKVLQAIKPSVTVQEERVSDLFADASATPPKRTLKAYRVSPTAYIQSWLQANAEDCQNEANLLAVAKQRNLPVNASRFKCGMGGPVYADCGGSWKTACDNYALEFTRSPGRPSTLTYLRRYALLAQPWAPFDTLVARVSDRYGKPGYVGNGSFTSSLKVADWYFGWNDAGEPVLCGEMDTVKYVPSDPREAKFLARREAHDTLLRKRPRQTVTVAGPPKELPSCNLFDVVRGDNSTYSFNGDSTALSKPGELRDVATGPFATVMRVHVAAGGYGEPQPGGSITYDLLRVRAVTADRVALAALIAKEQVERLRAKQNQGTKDIKIP